MLQTIAPRYSRYHVLGRDGVNHVCWGTKYQEVVEVLATTCGAAGEQNSSNRAREVESFKTLSRHDLPTTSFVYVTAVS